MVHNPLTLKLNRICSQKVNPKAKVAIELDGSQHFTPDSLAYDAERTVVLNSCNIKVSGLRNGET